MKNQTELQLPFKPKIDFRNEERELKHNPIDFRHRIGDSFPRTQRFYVARPESHEIQLLKTEKIPDIVQTAQTNSQFQETQNENQLFSNQDSHSLHYDFGKSGYMPFKKYKADREELPATTQTIQTISHNDHHTHQIPLVDSNSKFVLLSHESVSQPTYTQQEELYEPKFQNYFIDQPNYIDMNLKHIHRQIQEVLQKNTPKNLQKLSPNINSSKIKAKQARNQRQKSQIQPSQSKKHKYKAQEVLDMTQGLSLDKKKTPSKQRKSVSNNLGASISSSKYSKEEKAKIVETLLGIEKAKLNRKYPDQQSDDIPRFRQSEQSQDNINLSGWKGEEMLNNDQLMNILAHQQMQHSETSSIKRPCQTAIKRKDDDQEVESENDDENTLSFGKQTFLHSRNNSIPTKHPQNRSRDFKAEYAKLSEQLITQANYQPMFTPRNMNSLLLVTDQDLRNYHERILSQVRRVSQSGKSDIFQSLYEQRMRSSERHEQLRSLYEHEKELQFRRECTFQPDITSSIQRKLSPMSPTSVTKDYSMTRSPKQFFEDQMGYKMQVDHKVTSIKEQLVKAEIQKIHDFQKLMSERRQRSLKNVERMKNECNQSIEGKNQQLENANSRQSKFQINPNSKSVENFRDIKRKVDYERIFKLYRDASRLEEQNKKILEAQAHERKNSAEIAHRRSSRSPKSSDFLSQRLIKEQRMLFNMLQLNTEYDSLNYLQFVMVLQNMNYINKQKATDEENQLLVEAWNNLKTLSKTKNDEFKEGITFKNLNSFVHAIHYLVWNEGMLKEELKDSLQLNENRNFGHMTQGGIFYLRNDQERFQLHMKYRLFVHNKKYLEALLHQAHKHSLLQEEIQRYTYRPSLNEKSRTLAQHQFNLLSPQLLNKTSDQSHQWELLIKKGELYKDSIIQARVRKDQNLLQKCTFKPQLNDEVNKRRNSRSKVSAFIQGGMKQSESTLNRSLQARQLKELKLKGCQLTNRQNIKDETNLYTASKNALSESEMHLESPKQLKKHNFKQSMRSQVTVNNHSGKQNQLNENIGGAVPNIMDSAVVLNETANFQD